MSEARLDGFMDGVEHAKQLRLLHEVARAAGARFDIRVERWELLQYERNAVYGLTDHAGNRYGGRRSWFYRFRGLRLGASVVRRRQLARLVPTSRRRAGGLRAHPAAFLEAYAPAWGSPSELTRALCAFKAVRDAITLRFLAASRNQSVQSWRNERVAQLLRHIRGYLEGSPARV